MQKKIALVLALLSLIEVAVAASPQDLLKGYESQSGKASQARGELLFNAKQNRALMKTYFLLSLLALLAMPASL